MNIRTTTRAIGLGCLFALLAPVAPSHAQDKAPVKKLYCWNENGRRICGDALPADAADSARTEISANSGATLRNVERAQTDAERAVATAAAREAALASDRDAAMKRRDLAMVESYDTENDLRRAYGDRIVLVEESVKTSRMGTVNLRQSLLSLLRQAADLELQSKPVGKTLTDNIRRQHADLMRQQRILQEQLHDRASLDSDLEQALERYRALKGTPPTSG